VSAPWQGPGPDPLARAIEAQRRLEPGLDARPDPPGRLVPLPQYLLSRAWGWISWPWQKRQLKKAGWAERPGGWMEMP
jgi:hypothetical protein